MYKKLVFAAVAVTLALFVVRGPGRWWFSHARMEAEQLLNSAKGKISPEREIRRLERKINDLVKDDEKHIDYVAKLDVEVKKFREEIETIRKNLAKKEARLSKLYDEFAGNRTFVTFGDRRYTRDDLRSEALAFKAAEENLKSMEETLAAKQKQLDLENIKLSKLRSTRQQMLTKLQNLKTRLAVERHAQAERESSIDDAEYRRLNKEMDQLETAIEVMKKSRELRGQFDLDLKNEQAQERDTTADKFLQERFGNGKPPVEGNDGE